MLGGSDAKRMTRSMVTDEPVGCERSEYPAALQF